MHVDGMLATNLCLVTLFSSEQCSQCERFQHDQTKHPISKTKCIGNNADLSAIPFIMSNFRRTANPFQSTALPILGRGIGTPHLIPVGGTELNTLMIFQPLKLTRVFVLANTCLSTYMHN